METHFDKIIMTKHPAAQDSEPGAVNDPPDSDKKGRVSPDYTISRPVKLDPHVLMNNRCVDFQVESPYLEQYRVLRTRILHRTSNSGGKTIMITSAVPGEGKSLTAVNLAFTFAREYSHTVLLVDCDLKRQSIHQILGYPSDRGLAAYLLGKCQLSDVIVWPGLEKLTIISGGMPVGAGSELFGSPVMQQLVAEMRSRYSDRYILFDAPPVLVGADTMSLVPLVDHILFVVQAGRTSLPDIQKALQLLPREKIIGLVYNRQPAGQAFPNYDG